jgi:hypothetical protein
MVAFGAYIILIFNLPADLNSSPFFVSPFMVHPDQEFLVIVIQQWTPAGSS